MRLERQFGCIRQGSADDAVRGRRAQVRAAQIEAARTRKPKSDRLRRKILTNESGEQDQDARVGRMREARLRGQTASEIRSEIFRPGELS